MTSRTGSEPPEGEDRARRQEEAEAISATARRQIYVLVIAGFFLVLTLAVPDARLVRADAAIRWPLIQTEVELTTFLTYAPIALVALLIYLHLLVGRLIVLRREGIPVREVDVLVMSGGPSRFVAGFLLYAYVPLILAWFSWKAVFRDEAGLLIWTTFVVTFACAFLLYRRAPGTRGRIRLWTARAGLALAGLLAAAALVLALPWRDLGRMSGGFLVLDWKEPVLWLRRLDLKRADLSVGDELEFVNLAEQTLSYADARFSRLIGADLRDSDLSHANLREARIGGGKGARTTDFERADLDEADLQAADLRNVHFDHATLRGTWLEQALIGGTRFWCADLTGAKMNRIVGREGELLFQHAKLDGAELGAVKLDQPNFRFASLAEADLDLAVIQKGHFARADLTAARMRSGSLAGSSFFDAQLRRADLEGADLQGANLSGADATDANLATANLTGADLSVATLVAVEMSSVIAPGADFSGADLTGASLRYGTLTGAIFADAVLKGADLTGAKLGATDLTGTDLSSAVLEGATGIDGAALAAARLCDTVDPSGKLRRDHCQTETERGREPELEEEEAEEAVPVAVNAENIPPEPCARTENTGTETFLHRLTLVLRPKAGPDAD